ncbi:hypothetical protein CYMTET_15508 [Cymbomonas tetramitiformis]|uniref:3-hydroxyisobutyrate dehydrogenase n=1 Tax=Cymbomonas tetramitiformis TaxID=36881 RepID=A0AAE0GE79_9CHLO|nr:hypothetical protein CYMTET_15508 [Cymbomonas tetramitiformis]
MSVGFIGLGNMGLRMAKNLLKHRYQLVVYDRNQPAASDLVNLGAVFANSPAEVAEKSEEAIITMLPSSQHVREVYLGAEGIFSLEASGGEFRAPLLIDCSTIDPYTTRHVADMALQTRLAAGARAISESVPSPFLIDAPVSGGIVGAEAATLTFMVGGEEAAVDRARAILECMGKSVVHCGASGNGQAAKLCNNLALAISMAGVSEGLALGQKLGLDPRLLSSIFNSSSARCWSSDTYNPCPGVMPGVPSASEYNGGFAASLMAKDLHLASASAGSCNGKTPMGDAVQQLYAEMIEKGAGAKDFSGIFQHVYNGESATK